MLGKPLLDFTIQYAKSCPLIDEIYVSTDSQFIANYARQKEVKVVMRPLLLCGEAIIADVLRHCLQNIPHINKISRVVALQPDHPDRTVNLTEFLKRAIDLDIADAITIEPHGVRNGSIRILRMKDLMEGKISYSILAVQDHCTNIHTQADFEQAKRKIKMTHMYDQ